MYKKIIALLTTGILMTGGLTAYAASTARGDVDGDGNINVNDLSALAAHIKGIERLNGDALVQADVNFDDKIDVTDLQLLAAHIKGISKLPDDPNGADESFEGFDAYLTFADSDMNWGNWNGQGHPGALSFGVDADVTGDGVYTVGITRSSMTDTDDMGKNPSIGSSLGTANGCTVMWVDITGLLDGTLAADGSELEGFLSDGENANVNKGVKGRFRGDEIQVELVSIEADGREIAFDASKVRCGNLEEEDNCYRIEIANLLTSSAGDAAIDVDSLSFSSSLNVTFRITGID